MDNFDYDDFNMFVSTLPELSRSHILHEIIYDTYCTVRICVHKEDPNTKLLMKTPTKNLYECSLEIIEQARRMSIVNVGDSPMIKYHGLFQHDGLPCFVMDYVEGHNLDQDCGTRYSFSDLEIRKIFLDCIKDLEHIHQCDMYHGDIRGANIMFNDKRATLIDMYPRLFSIEESEESEESEDSLVQRLHNLSISTTKPIFQDKIKNGWNLQRLMMAADIADLAIFIKQLHCNCKGCDNCIQHRICDDGDIITMLDLHKFKLEDKQLESILNECLNLDPEKRPSAHHILQHLNN